jgi:hypothetical protein
VTAALPPLGTEIQEELLARCDFYDIDRIVCPQAVAA